MGVRDAKKQVTNLALDRIVHLQVIDSQSYIPNEGLFPEKYYQDVFGVTVSPNLRPMIIKIFVSNQHAPYVKTKPLHHSQQVLEEMEQGIIIQLQVQHNFEIEKEILGFCDGMTVLEPQKVRDILTKRLENAYKKYVL